MRASSVQSEQEHVLGRELGGNSITSSGVGFCAAHGDMFLLTGVLKIENVEIDSS